jgi:WD40 repeat protein
MSFDPTGKILAVAFHIPGKKSPKPISTGIGGRPDWDVKLWDVATGQVAESLKGHKGVVRAVAFSPKGGFLASSGDKPLRIWDVAASREVASLPMATWNLAFSSDGRTLAAAGGVGKKVVKVWSLP